MIDTHCHLNFSRFKKNIPQVIDAAYQAGVTNIIIPGTDIPTSQKAIQIASEFEHVYAAVGIHPHHVYELVKTDSSDVEIDRLLQELSTLVQEKKVVAVGEVGMDRHTYEQTKYEEYSIDEKFIALQSKLLQEQIQLAVTSRKSLILHNREAKQDLLPIVEKEWSSHLQRRAVFHCCEPDEQLLEFAKTHRMFIGVDGDISYFPEKQEFIKKVPLEMLVLETDSPFLLPEPLRSQKLFPNSPVNIPLIAQIVADLKSIPVEDVDQVTTANAKELFQIS